MARRISSRARCPLRLRQALGIRSRADGWWRIDWITVRPFLETAVPEQTTRIELIVLQAAQPIVHLVDELGEDRLLSLHECLREGRCLPRYERQAAMVLPPRPIIDDCLAGQIALPCCRPMLLASEDGVQSGAGIF